MRFAGIMGAAAAILLLVGSVCAARESYNLEEISFLPVRYYVGDQVELRIRVDLTEDLQLVPPDPLPRSSWLVVRKVSCARIREREWRVRIFFTTFRPGSHILPEIDLSGIRLADLRAETRSILDDKGKERFYGYKGQLFLPGTWYRIAIALFLILGMPPLLYRTVKLGTRVVRRYRRVLERQLPRTRLLHALERLRKGLSETDPRDFFIQVTRVLRDYFSGRLQLQAHMATTLELEHLLPERLSQFCPQPDAENLSERVVSLFKKADGIKFGGRGATENEMIETIDQASEICGSVEEVVQSVEL